MMGVSSKTREEAFALYCAGVSYLKIANTLKVGSASIPRWKDKYDWESRKLTLMGVIEENDKTDKEKINEKMLESIKRVWAKQVEQGLAKASARDVIEVVKVERLREGLSTENVNIDGNIDINDIYLKNLEIRKKRELESKEN
jgi:transposase